MATSSRKRTTTSIGILALVAVALLLTATGDAAAQIPDKFTNLKVLPKEISKGELIGIMRGYAGDLGVRCNHCHVGPANLQGMDFATDEKAEKKTARTMMKMVNKINGTHLSSIDTGRTERVEVTCQTCHHRLAVPRLIEDVVAHSIESDGLEAGLKKYRELREEHYGGAAYDFTQKPVNSLAESLSRGQKIDEALALLEMNIEFNPEDSYTRMLQGGIFRATGEKDKAIASFRKAVELDPKNRWAKGELAKLENADK